MLLVSGIWPPDVGGPASHGPEFGAFLAARGWGVQAVTTADRHPERPAFPLQSLRRDVSLPRRLAEGAASLAVATRRADIVYATGMYARAAAATRAARTPLVLKLVNDPAYERARSLGLFAGTIEDFQRPLGDARVRALKRLRGLTLARAARLVVPSQYLARFARAWGVPADRIDVIPNSAPAVPRNEPREQLRRRLGIDGPTLVFAGRIVIQKNLELAIAALALAPEARLAIVGDGPERGRIERAAEEARVAERVRFEGPRPRDAVIEWLRAADAALLSSAWENFPHAAVEALEVGTPVVATAVGGVPEIVCDRENGLLVPPDSARALAAAMSAVCADSRLRDRLRVGAERTRGRYRPERVYGRIERVLEEALAERP